METRHPHEALSITKRSVDTIKFMVACYIVVITRTGIEIQKGHVIFPMVILPANGRIVI